MVPETLIFSAEFENLDSNNEAFPATPDPHCLFERMDIRLGGQLVESVTDVGRCNELFTRLTMSPQKKVNLAQTGFGTAIPSAEPDWSSAQNHEAKKIPKGSDGGTKRIFWRANLFRAYVPQGPVHPHSAERLSLWKGKYCKVL